ncbi:hypothetical protein ACPYPG_02995 [Streptomyces sp. FR-108]|uniref:hypothetical protein n=1 Tax=Streptomyces sp. FR-108 TaxID=3416665 RepID=UPI003CF57EAA
MTEAQPPAARPMLRLDADDAVQAPYLSYNVPDPTSYPGRTYMLLAFSSDADPFGVPAAQDAEDTTGIRDTHGGSTGFKAVAGQSTARMLDTDRDPLPKGKEKKEPGEVDNPTPQARLKFETPAPGTNLTVGEAGATLKVVVQVHYEHTPVRPAHITLTAMGTSTRAPRTSMASSSNLLYSGDIMVRPGTVNLVASVTLGDAEFTTATVVQVAPTPLPAQPSYPQPQVVIDTPRPGRDIYLAVREQLQVPVAGAVIGGGDTVTVTLALDGAGPLPLQLDSQHRWSTVVTLDPGRHALTITATDEAKRSATASREQNIVVGAFPKRRLVLVDCLRLSNFLGRYGAGRVVQTMSLLPGEKTTINIRTFRSMKVEEAKTESILESAGSKSTSAFEDAVAAESSTASKEQSAFSAKVTASASASWGVASASVSAEAAYNTASAREDAAKRVSNATRRHASEKSSERTVNVEGKTATTSGTEDEQTINRELSNANLSRTLNFVFRQMTQEFVSLLHLVDVRIGMITQWFQDPAMTVMLTTDDGLPRQEYEEVTLPELRGWLRQILGPGALGDREANVANVYRTVLAQLDGVFDHRGEHAAILQQVTRHFPVRDADGALLQESDPGRPGEQRPVTREERWLRFDPSHTQTWNPADQHTAGDAGGITLSFTVPGVILSANVVTLRTDGVVCDAFLGGGPALDVYSTELQRTAIASRTAEADKARAEAERVQLGVDIVTANEKEKSSLYQIVFPPPAAPNGAPRRPEP